MNIAAKKETRLNDQITAPEVRLIGADGEQVGIVSLEDAKQKAGDLTLDLVEIQPQAEPPVCRIMDFGKFRFERSKQKQSSKKKTKRVSVKEIKFRPNTDIGDYNIKLRNLKKFLDDGDRTKVTLRFRGREMAHQELGADLLKRVQVDLEEHGTVEQFPKMEGRQMVMLIAPRKGK